MRTPFVNHVNPEASHGLSAMKPTTTVACANDADVLDGLQTIDQIPLDVRDPSTSRPNSIDG